MIGIPDDILKRMREVLLESGKFRSDEILRSVFLPQSISYLRDDLPQADTVKDRINFTIDFLKDKRTITNQSALVLFLRALSDLIHPQDACYREIVEIAAIYEYVLRHANEHVSDQNNIQKYGVKIKKPIESEQLKIGWISVTGRYEIQPLKGSLRLFIISKENSKVWPQNIVTEFCDGKWNSSVRLGKGLLTIVVAIVSDKSKLALWNYYYKVGELSNWRPFDGPITFYADECDRVDVKGV